MDWGFCAPPILSICLLQCVEAGPKVLAVSAEGYYAMVPWPSAYIEEHAQGQIGLACMRASYLGHRSTSVILPACLPACMPA